METYIIIPVAFAALSLMIFLASRFVILSVESQKKYAVFFKHFAICGGLAILGYFTAVRHEVFCWEFLRALTVYLAGIAFLLKAQRSFRMRLVRFLKNNPCGIFCLETIVPGDEGEDEYWGTLQVGHRKFRAQLAVGICTVGEPMKAEYFIKFDAFGALDFILVYQMI